MAQGVTDKGALSVVEHGDPAQTSLEGLQLGGLSPDVGVEFFDSPPYDVELVQDEIRQVVAVSFRVQEGPVVPRGRFEDDAGDRDELAQPEIVAQHRPIKQ